MKYLLLAIFLLLLLDLVLGGLWLAVKPADEADRAALEPDGPNGKAGGEV